MLGLTIFKIFLFFLALVFFVRRTVKLFEFLLFKRDKDSQEKTGNNPQGKDETSTQARQAEIFNPWQVLGLKKGAQREEIEAAYKQKIKGNHPDKLANLDPYLQKIANERMKQINRAYSELIN